MELKYQDNAIEELKRLADSDAHSILVEGRRGSGKTHLAQEFADMKGIDTFNAVNPKVVELKETIESSLKLDDNQVVCIENLDLGVSGASQAILKYLEEPLPNIYIVVTCINLLRVPTTIRSRSMTVKLHNPSPADLASYAQQYDSLRYNTAKDYLVFQICKSISDVKEVMNFTVDQLQYYDSVATDSFWADSIDRIMWNLGHYPNNEKANLKFSLRCLMDRYKSDKDIYRAALDALLALESSRISETAVLGKLVLDLKIS